MTLEHFHAAPIALALCLTALLGTNTAHGQADEAEASDHAEAEGSPVRVDIHPLSPGFVHQVTERQDRMGLRLEVGARAVFDGENGAYLDAGLDAFFSGGSGLGWSGGWSGRATFNLLSVEASGTVEAGYLHRFVLEGSGRRGVALDLGAGATAAWIGAQVSPGVNVLASLDGRLGGFVMGLEVRTRFVAWFTYAGQAEPLVEYQALLRIGFGFGG